jgi:hypothetical protein
MGNLVGRGRSAGVVQKLLPKRHNRERPKLCGGFATPALDGGSAQRRQHLEAIKKPGFARPLYLLI